MLDGVSSMTESGEGIEKGVRLVTESGRRVEKRGCG